MRLEPRGKQVIGRIAISQISTSIAAPDPTKGVTKFVMLEEVSPAAEAEGYRVGDLVLPRAINSIFLRGGAFHRAVFSFEEILCVVRDLPLNTLVDVDGKPFKAAEAA